jgi:3alpha(or 20beta)-hydroxysteroid dehydrogenase
LPAYAASKAANASLTQTAAMELGVYGIRVNAVAPGGIDTAMSNAPEFDAMDREAWYGKLPIARIGQVEDVAHAVLFLACSESCYMTGTVVPVDAGQLAGHRAL